MRGEDLVQEYPPLACLETPPHAWGRRWLTNAELWAMRNTPTCVGKTFQAATLSFPQWKHPHMRGEDSDWRGAFIRDGETPPHAWGRRERKPAAGREKRNTPTCVGKTFTAVCTASITWKHPHMRGEDNHACLIHHISEETPPHAWGRPTLAISAELCPGNTPTCVGKTICEKMYGNAMEKHPHMRGEDLLCRETRNRRTETPPHAWGRRVFGHTDEHKNGNTPTCVGKTPRDCQVL